MFRVGFGQDSHRFSNNLDKKLVLGGVKVFGAKGLEGNSDADVVLHALCNALEQAIGGNSLSTYSDQMCKNGIVDSAEYLKVAVRHIKEAGYIVNNAGISIEAKTPKIADISDSMREALKNILEIKNEDIGINATSGEGLTAFGRGEGIQCFAIVSLIKNEKS